MGLYREDVEMQDKFVFLQKGLLSWKNIMITSKINWLIDSKKLNMEILWIQKLKWVHLPDLISTLIFLISWKIFHLVIKFPGKEVISNNPSSLSQLFKVQMRSMTMKLLALFIPSSRLKMKNMPSNWPIQEHMA